MSNAPAYTADWLETDCRIFTGTNSGFTETIHLNADIEPQAGSVFAKSFWKENDYWGFVFEGGHVCLVNDNRVRYIKGRIISASASKAEREDIIEVDVGSDELSKDIHSGDPTPKRRGRPPKIKSE